MRKQSASMLLAIFIDLATYAVVAGAGTSALAVDDCITAPNSLAPMGSHWYYRTDRVKQRKCWFVGPQRLSAHRAAAGMAPRMQTLTTSPAPLIPVSAGAITTGSASAEQPAPQDEHAGKTADVWKTFGIAMTRGASPHLAEIVEREGSVSNVVPGQATPMMREQQSDARNEGHLEPLAVLRIASTTAGTPMRVLLVIAGGFLVVVFLLSVIFKIASSARRQVRAGRRHGDWNQGVPSKWAPSIFDIAEVPALAPIGRTDQ